MNLTISRPSLPPITLFRLLSVSYAPHPRTRTHRARSSSVPWRNPIRPPPSPKEQQPAPAAPASPQPTAKDLKGYTVVMMANEKQSSEKGGETVLGVVKEVLTSSYTRAPHGLLKVVAAELVLPPRRGSSSTTPPTDVPHLEVQHLIPLVRSIVPHIDTANRKITVDPPEGLLDLGRRQALLQHLRTEVAPLASLSPSGVPTMPKRRELEAAGRKDLVRLIVAAGGFVEVAQELGLRSARRPPGYWQDEEALDRELSLFVAANWARFDSSERDAGSDSSSSESEEESAPTGTAVQGETYWYNPVTRRVRWEAPVEPQVVPLDDEGSVILTESEDDRAMPSRSALLAAGRYDLHAAIVAAGGYVQVAEELDRWPAWPPTRHLRKIRTLAAELREFASEHGLPRQRMPTANELLDLGRSDLHQAVVKHGGYVELARRLRWKTQRLKRGAWQDLEWAAREVAAFAVAEAKRSNSCSGRVHDSFNNKGNGGGERGRGLEMPTHEELRAAGRHDLRHALQRHGSAAVAEAAGLELGDRRGVGGKSIKELEKVGDDAVAEIPEEI